MDPKRKSEIQRLENLIEQAEKLKLVSEVNFRIPPRPGTQFTVEVGKLAVSYGYGLHNRKYRPLEVSLPPGLENFIPAFSIKYIGGWNYQELDKEGNCEIPSSGSWSFSIHLSEPKFKQAFEELRKSLDDARLEVA